ncbi:MAG: STAS domain-containing protein [Ignavibacteriae bacterium]|nr:anti-sigma factor antagonist [Ignavibacteriota bacterium]NOG98214.1 STAS domain-containing protein [Ignavibacteriota bacterium]
MVSSPDNQKFNYDMDLIGNFLSVENIDDVVIVNVQLYSANLEKAVPFRDYLMKMVNDGKTKFLIDLSQTEYIDSTFLGSLVFVLKKLKSMDGAMHLILGKSSKATTMFEITNMNRVFKVFDTVEEAKKNI